MNWHVQLQSSTTPRRTPLILGGVALATGLFSACGGGSPAALSSVNVNVVTSQPDNTIGSEYFIGDSHFNGDASQVKITGIFWGRLVDVVDSSGDVQLRDFQISDSIRDDAVFLPSVGDPIVYDLQRNAITDQFVLTIPAEAGTIGFDEALRNLELNRTPVFDKSLEAGEVGPFPMVPRNSVMVIEFDDLLEPVFDNGGWQDGHGGAVADVLTGQLNKDLVKVATGYPPALPYEALVFLDPNHGNLSDRDGDDVAEFYSTRVIISPTISSIDALETNPPLAINSIGLPASLVTDSANLALRIPTNLSAGLGQTQILRNASGKALAFSGNGSTSNSTGTLDVVRALRSGGELTQDPNNGFLLDEDFPRILGDLAVSISGTPVANDPERPERFTIPQLLFAVPACAAAIKVGDVLIQSGVSSIVVDPGQPTPGQNVVVDVIAPTGGILLPGGAQLQTPFVPATDTPACFLRFSPIPGSAPATDVQPDAAIFVRFSEPMDPETIKPFDSFTITNSVLSPNGSAFDYAIGRVVPEADLRSFRWDHPEVPFSHAANTPEQYVVTLAQGDRAPTDLAGNPVVLGMDPVTFTLDPAAQELRSAGFALRFETLADDLFNDGLAELRNGQLLYDPTNERILPRPVNRLSSAADTNQPLPSLMTPFVGGVQTPLSNLGSKLQTLWRYTDVGFSLTDETGINVDVEGLSWAPVNGVIVADAYDEFSVALAHSEYLPDEQLNPNSGFPNFPASGLKMIYANNLNDPLNDPGTIVHHKSVGYIVNPANLYQASSGRTMLPFPLNEDNAVEDYVYYTWRDTAITAVGGPSGVGAMLASEMDALGGGMQVWPPNQVPTSGLPLLMEFRCYPSSLALGLNAFEIALAANSSARPNFRAFSTGGFDGTQLQYVDPDNSDTATGGFNPGNGGAATPGTDNSFYFGEMALVTRISRIHSIWFDTGEQATTYAQPVIEPEAEDQPAGTSVTLSFRGAIGVDMGLQRDSAAIDLYGNGTPTPTFLGGDTNWKADISEINSARYFQIRINFISNAATERTAEVRTLAFAYFKG